MKKFQVVGIGNAMVDVLAHAEDAFLDANGIGKGIMQLIDMDRAVALYDRIGPAREISGGSAANTIAGVAARSSRSRCSCGLTFCTVWRGDLVDGFPARLNR